MVVPGCLDNGYIHIGLKTDLAVMLVYVQILIALASSIVFCDQTKFLTNDWI